MNPESTNNPNRIRKIVRASLIGLSLASVLTACSPRISTHGNYPREEQMLQLVEGQSNKKAIFDLLGPPTNVGTFDSEIWYYMTQTFERFAFYEPEMTDMRVIAFYFDEKGVYQASTTYDLDDVKRIALEDEITHTAGNELSFMQQMFGNFTKTK